MFNEAEYVKTQLERRGKERQLTIVAAGAGVSRRTIDNVLAGHNVNVRTVKKLYDYLRKNYRKTALPDPKRDENI